MSSTSGATTFAMPTAVGRTTIGASTISQPPRTRKPTSPSTHVTGRSRTASRAATDVAPIATAAPRPYGRCRASTERRKAARTVSASSFARIVAARAGSNRKAARIASGARQVRSGSSGGTSMPTRIWSRPASSRMNPESAPDRAGPSRASGGSGGGPDVGATSRKLTTPSSSVTHISAIHQPSGASDGRAIPARSARSPMRTSCSRRNDGPGGGSRSGTAASLRGRGIRPADGPRRSAGRYRAPRRHRRARH